MKPLRLARLPSRLLLIFALLSVLLSQTAAVPAAPTATTVDTIYALAFPDSLIRFRSTSPATIDQTTPITGLLSGTTLVGIDFRLNTGQLYAIGINGTSNRHGRVYTINPDTGVASLVSSTPFSTSLQAGGWAIDLNPVPDRIRLVNNQDTSLRVNPATGQLSAVDISLHRPSNDPYVAALAYDRNTLGVGSSTLYGIDWYVAQLVMIGGVDGTPSANAGLVSEVGQLGIHAQTATIGFDISSGGAAYASLSEDIDSYSLYSINLSTGTATLIDTIGAGGPVSDIAIRPRYTLFLPLVRR
jgi:hypothetical protein